MASSVAVSSSVTVVIGGEDLNATQLHDQNEVGLSRLVGAALGAALGDGDGRGSTHKGRFRSPADIRDSDDGMLSVWENWRKDICETIAVRGRAIGKTLEEREWQFDAAISMLCGLDTTVITATSDGKSFAYQILPIMKPESTILCVSPLVALQEDQVRACEKLGIKACALNAKNIEFDRDLLTRVSSGDYQAVFVTPEFIRPENGNFVRLLGLRSKTYTPFKKRCIALVIDESHLVFHWRKFRKQYITLGIIRSFFSGVPIMTLSATSPPHVRKRVNYTLGMAQPSTLIERSIDRPNIYLSVEYVRSSLTSYLDLNYLIPKSNQCASPADIPKTIVFVDNRKSVWSLTTHLLEVARDEYGFARDEYGLEKFSTGEFSHLIADYSTILSQEHRDAVLHDFAAGYIRILVCTEAAGMGVDIADVQRVIQWGVPNFINLSTLWQRMGRAGRSRDTQAVFTLWLQKSMRIKTSDALAIYRSPIKENDPATKAIISSIIDFEENVDQLAARFGTNITTGFDEEEALTVMDNPESGSVAPRSASDEAVTIPLIPKSASRDPRLRFDRGILALGSTTGCYRALFLKYFNSTPQPLISPNHCCACCAPLGSIPERIKELLPPDNITHPQNADSRTDNTLPNSSGDFDDNIDEELEDGEDQPDTLPCPRGARKRTPYYIALAALPQLHAFRMQISMEHSKLVSSADTFLSSADTFLSDDEIRKISKSICGITEPHDFCRFLKTGEHYHLAPIASYIQRLLNLCQQISTTTPRPAPRRRTHISLSIPDENRTPVTRDVQTSENIVLDPNSTTTTAVDPPTAAPSKPTGARSYDPKKRREYYLKAKARKQREENSTLQNINCNTQVNPSAALLSSEVSTASPKRRLHPPVDQENIPPSKILRIR